ncbi:hypothetical protein BASA81_010726 [Batrachochytrium salamandrivorans]|nr:hypothetical protein BASA81_010726 [Batrachochytrium salamandrivorans]
MFVLWRRLRGSGGFRLLTNAAPLMGNVDSAKTRPLSGYNLFTKEFFQKHPAKHLQDVAAEWKLLSAEQKQDYSTQAANLPHVPVKQKLMTLLPKRQYTAWDVFLVQFQASPQSKGVALHSYMREATKQYKKLTNEEKLALVPREPPTKHAPSPWNLFLGKARQDPSNVGRTFGEIAKLAGQQYRLLSTEEKAKLTASEPLPTASELKEV